jgi:hypothetical protein
MAQLHVLSPLPPPTPSAATRPAATLSQRLWDLDWTTILPWQLDDDVTIHPGRFDEASEFARAHYPRIFGTGDGRFIVEPTTPAKKRFGAEMDIFLFHSRSIAREHGDDGIFGFFCGHPSDWSTYYLRSMAFLPECRRKHYGSAFFSRICEALGHAGIARIEGDTAPTNIAVGRILSKLGFIVTSTVCSERWGMLLRFTKFLESDLGASFTRQFIAVAIDGPNPSQPEPPEEP